MEPELLFLLVLQLHHKFTLASEALSLHSNLPSPLFPLLLAGEHYIENVENILFCL
jgi:hypothetical protein